MYELPPLLYVPFEQAVVTPVVATHAIPGVHALQAVELPSEKKPATENERETNEDEEDQPTHPPQSCTSPLIPHAASGAYQLGMAGVG